MTLSDEDRRRIDEEEYRKLSRERLERTVRAEADSHVSIVQPIEAPTQPAPATRVFFTPASLLIAVCAPSVAYGAVATGGLSLIPIGCVALIYGVYKLGSRSR